jgi:hypothetical protein
MVDEQSAAPFVPGVGTLDHPTFGQYSEAAFGGP